METSHPSKGKEPRRGRREHQHLCPRVRQTSYVWKASVVVSTYRGGHAPDGQCLLPRDIVEVDELDNIYLRCAHGLFEGWICGEGIVVWEGAPREVAEAVRTATRERRPWRRP